MTAKTMTNAALVPALKPLRAMHTQSPVFEAAYATFMADVFDRNVMSVRCEETETTRALVLADMQRVVLDKSTGLLRYEKRALVADGQLLGVDGPWGAANGFPFTSFWAPNSEVSSAITAAWHVRIWQFIPAPALCYPDGVPPRFKEDFPHADRLCDMFVGQAADRRRGGRKVRRSGVLTAVGCLWNFLGDREVLRLCHAYFGRKASLKEYNFTVQRRAELMARAAETPNFTPLIGLYLRHHPTLKSGRNRVPMDVLASAKKAFFTAEEPPARAATVGRAPPPTPLPREPLSPAGWRYLAGVTRVGIEQIWRLATRDTGEGLPSAVRLAPLLNLLARTGDAHPLAFITWALAAAALLEGVARPEAGTEHARESLLRFMRLAGRQATLAKKKGQLKRFVKGDLILSWDWFMNREARSGRPQLAEVRPLPKNATWASVMRTQHEWHAARAERERVRREADLVRFLAHQARQDVICWDSSVGAYEMAGVLVTPLTTGLALREEGEQMDHCVGGYVGRCKDGTSRIFHLTHGAEQATLELITTPRRAWRVNQVFGPSNDDVSPQIATAAKALAKRYQAAEARRVASKKPAQELLAA